MLYSTLNPLTAVTLGSVKADAQVFAGALILGALGKITTFTKLLTPQEPVPPEPAAVEPQAAANTYRAVTLWQPGVVGSVGVCV